MDKYTVDLDQVLNDFEYSELTTEQSSTTSKSYENPRNNYGTSKHSINNVFSSLNDYLSTEIGELNTCDNNLSSDSSVNYKPYSPNPAYSSTFVDASSSLRDAGDGPSASRVDTIRDKLIKEEKGGESGEVFRENEGKLPEDEPEGKISVLIREKNEIEAEIAYFGESVTTGVEKNDENNVENENFAKNCAIEAKQLTLEATEMNLNANDATTKESSVIEANIVDIEANKSEIEANNEKKVLVIQEKSSENESGLKSSISIENSQIKSEKPQESSNKIGFEDAKVTYDEVKQYLEELELSDEDDDDVDDVIEPEIQQECRKTEGKALGTEKVALNVKDNSFKKQTKTVSKTKENVSSAVKVKGVSSVEEVEGSKAPINVNVEVGVQSRPNNLDIKDVGEENGREINLIGNPGSTPYNNVYINKEITGGDEATFTPPVSPSTSPPSSSSSSQTSPTISEASTDSVHSSHAADLNARLEAVVNESLPLIQHDVIAAAGAGDTLVPPKETVKLRDADEEQHHGDEEDEEEDEEVDEEEEEEDEEEEDERLQVNVVTHETAAAAADSDGVTSENSEDVYVDIDSITNRNEVASQLSNQTDDDSIWLGKRAPVWIPDSDALNCQHCDLKFTVIKRRHHCRACGLVLCSKCCNMKCRLEYLNSEARVCTRCDAILSNMNAATSSESENSTPNRNNANNNNASSQQQQQPHPNNPMDYCSVIPPPLQQGSAEDTPPPAVLVPVGVLKRSGSNKKHNKSVMFCDGIRPGSDLTNLDNDFNYNLRSTRDLGHSSKSSKNVSSQQQQQQQQPTGPNKCPNIKFPSLDASTNSFIPENEDSLPPTVSSFKSVLTYRECGNNANVVEMLRNETLVFALQRNLFVSVKLIDMSCCVNKQCWCFASDGLMNVGQDEVIVLVEYVDGETLVPKDIFKSFNNIYSMALKGTTISELGLYIHPTTNFLNSKNHAGFVFIRPTFQCLQNVPTPAEPYLVGLLVHRWETPWARIFPLRLVLRLGAEYRYYPSPIISTRNRDSVFVEIGHTIINLLADFRNFSYTLPNIRGLTIHMEEKSTTVRIPANRYDQVMKSIGNSSEHILTFGGNFSTDADSHLVCIQDTQGNSDNNNYKTHAINIENQPRKITGASFIVFNGALKSSSGLTAKSSIVEDGLMIQIHAEEMVLVRESLRNMKNHTIQCGCINAASDETVSIVWAEPDAQFNMGVSSCVDGRSLAGTPSIRVHNGKDYVCSSGQRLIRWTEVFLIESGEENARTQDPVDLSKVAESVSKAACQALVKYLDLMASAKLCKVAIRATLHVDNVSYSAGSNGVKLPPIYMKSLDNELVPVLHRITSSGNVGDGTVILELVFRILNV